MHEKLKEFGVAVRPKVLVGLSGLSKVGRPSAAASEFLIGEGEFTMAKLGGSPSDGA